jgi:hypothetical protein
MLIDEVKALIAELKKENSVRSEKIGSPGISQYNNSFYVHTYNNTLEIIKRLENIIK